MNATRAMSNTRGGAVLRRCLAMLAAVVLAVALAPSASAAPPDAGPTLFVDPDAETITGAGWGDHVVVVDVLADVILGEIDPAGGDFTLHASRAIREGQLIRASDGSSTADVTVTALSVRAVDPMGNTISGTAERNSKVSLRVGDPNAVEVVLKADGTGAWRATEAEIGDVIIGSLGWATQYQTVASGTRVAWAAHLPVFRVQPTTPDEGAAVHSAAVGDRLGAGYQWPADTDLTITVRDAEGGLLGEEAVTTDANGEFMVGPLGYDVAAGDTVTVETGNVPTLGVISKAMTVGALAVTAKSPDADLIAGTAEPGSTVYVQPTLSDEPVGCYVVADASGTWTAEFADGGNCPAYDVGNADGGTMGYAAQSEVEAGGTGDGDATHVAWHLWSPNVQVDPQRDVVYGPWWSAAAGLDVGVDGDDYVTVTVSVEGIEGSWSDIADGREDAFEVDLGAHGVDIVPGDVVTVEAPLASGGTLTRTHTVADVRITDVDVDADAISGVALTASGEPADEGILVVVYDDTGSAQRVTAITQEVKNPAKDVVGSWIADFGAVGTELGSSEAVFDITAATTIEAGVGDGDGGTTAVRVGVPVPKFFVDPAQDKVWGFDWAADAEVSVKVAGTEVGPAFAGSDGYFELGVSEAVDLQSGQFVEVSDAVTTRSTTVTALSITAVDADADTVSGTADRKVPLTVGIFDDEGATAAEQSLTPTRTTWTVYVGGIEPGTAGYAYQRDADGDATQVDWAAEPVEPPPMATFTVDPWQDVVWGGDWGPGTEVSISVEGVVVATAAVGDDGGFWADLSGGTDVAAGDVVAVTDATVTKDTVVPALSVTDVDVVLDTVTGSTDTAWPLAVGIWDDEGQSAAELNPEPGDPWMADFWGVHDIGTDTSGYVGQVDDDGDTTWLEWAVVPAVP